MKIEKKKIIKKSFILFEIVSLVWRNFDVFLKKWWRKDREFWVSILIRGRVHIE